MTTDNNTDRACPCHSGNPYKNCCQPFHRGKLPNTALQLMRSRYAAYALSLPDYIIQTTHPGSPQFHDDTKQWSEQIAEFCSTTQFKNLEILHSEEKSSIATVTFFVHLTQEGKDFSFTERSYFEKIKGQWLYRSGLLSAGHAPNLIPTHTLQLLPIAYYGLPVLRKVADPIVTITDDVRQLAEAMIETMDAFDGMGLAAPQVHHSKRLFVMRRPVEMEGQVELQDVKVFINPILSLHSEESWNAYEGCISIPSIDIEVTRPKAVTIEYLDLQGNKMKETVSGWEARVIMHEVDHLNGVLFIDHLEPQERQAMEPSLKSLQNRLHVVL